MRTIKGKTFRNMYGPESIAGKGEEKLIFPSLSIDLEYLPEARSWKNGNTYEVTLRLKQTSIREDERGGSVGFDIVGVSVLSKESVKKGKLAEKTIERRYEEMEEDDDSDE